MAMAGFGDGAQTESDEVEISRVERGAPCAQRWQYMARGIEPSGVSCSVACVATNVRVWRKTANTGLRVCNLKVPNRTFAPMERFRKWGNLRVDRFGLPQGAWAEQGVQVAIGRDRDEK